MTTGSPTLNSENAAANATATSRYFETRIMSIEYANMSRVTIVPLGQNTFLSKVKHYRCNVNCLPGDVIWIAGTLVKDCQGQISPVNRVKVDSSLE